MVRESRNNRVVEPSSSQEDHHNLSTSIRRHVRRNRNLFSGNVVQRQGSAANSHPDLRNEGREQDPLLEEGKSFMIHNSYYFNMVLVIRKMPMKCNSMKLMNITFYLTWLEPKRILK